jgi:hypothetical protein
MEREGVNCIHVAQDRIQLCAVVNRVMNLQMPLCIKLYMELDSCVCSTVTLRSLVDVTRCKIFGHSEGEITADRDVTAQ